MNAYISWFSIKFYIFSLCQLINKIFQKFVEENSQPLRESIYEEMVAGQKAKELADQLARNEKEKIEAQINEDKNKKMMEEIIK